MKINKQIFLGLGSNIGNCLDNLKEALTRIALLPDIKIENYSSVYETAPVGYLEQDNFLNMVAEISTVLSPELFLEKIQKIESDLGRIRKFKWGPRVIDIDILFWGADFLKTDTLQIPHSEIEKRRFVLIPLNEIAPKFKTPHQLQEIGELLKNVQDNSWVELFLSKEKFEFNQ
ncbi:MAG: 2-amino-4-hydroxy-6-hydroxymethyldihydropteridine diphosphokinase [bacterium]